MKQQNPSNRKFGSIETSTEVLKAAKDKLRPYRKMTTVLDAKKNPDKYSMDMGTCWMCWVEITGEWLESYRYEPFSQNKHHEEVCPLCGYSHWKGRIWFPFRFKRHYIGNPSARDGIK